ncbi:MAG: serpin family protein [Bacilli bacterium]|nr:serpin family protein [Bacilli bacterium]
MNRKEKELKEFFKEELNEHLGIKDYDTSNFKLESYIENSPKKNNSRILIPVFSLGAIILIIVPLIVFKDKIWNGDKLSKYPSLKEGETYKESVKSIREIVAPEKIALAKKNTFVPLNEIDYPSTSISDKEANYSDEFINSYINFSNITYNALDKNINENFGYSPVTLYGTLNNLSFASFLNEEFDDLLGLNTNERIIGYKTLFENNYYKTKDNGVTMLHNAAFFSNKYSPNKTYLDKITETYTEAYSLDLQNDNDVERMISWVDRALETGKFLDKKELNLNNNSAAVLFSCLYFNNPWEEKYKDDDTKIEPFFISETNSVDASFMHHSYYSNGYYDYGKYIAIDDYYENGYKITYFVPKIISDNIFDLTDGKNFFLQDENCFVSSKVKTGMLIKMATPKFKLTNTVDLYSPMEKLGLGKLFDSSVNSLPNMFENLSEGTNVYLQYLAQKNQIEFSEDGTIIRSVVEAVPGTKTGSSYIADILEVNLDQPFIYTIKDRGGMPIFIGSVSDPTK